MSDTTHRCPRRMENPSGVFKFLEGDDTWRPNDTCSYCGSLNPDMVMERLEAGDVEIIPTDKSYKAYIRNAGGRPFTQRWRTDDKPWTGDESQHVWETRETQEMKFYFQHFSEEQQRRFIELHNAGRLKIGMPGYFYVVPFFCKREPAPKE